QYEPVGHPTDISFSCVGANTIPAESAQHVKQQPTPPQSFSHVHPFPHVYGVQPHSPEGMNNSPQIIGWQPPHTRALKEDLAQSSRSAASQPQAINTFCGTPPPDGVALLSVAVSVPDKKCSTPQ